MANWLFDAGHGGTDSGAASLGRLEKNDVLSVVLEAKRIMELNGETVDLTRSTDVTVSLADRVRIEHNKTYDYFVSFHRNSGGGIGVETFCYKTSIPKAYKLAVAVQKALCDAGLANANRGVKEGDFMVIRETRCDAILVEMGFIDNLKDNELFAAKYKDYAKEICRACLAQIGKAMITETTAKYYVKTSGIYGKNGVNICEVKAKYFSDIDRVYAYPEGEYITFATQYLSYDKCSEVSKRLQNLGLTNSIIKE